jgi:hypothetical protein
MQRIGYDRVSKIIAENPRDPAKVKEALEGAL